MIKEALTKINEGIKLLREEFKDSERKFTIDGRLVGDIGEVIAEANYKIKLYPGNKEDHDATTKDGKKVQIKATFKDKLTIPKKTPEYYLGLQLKENGDIKEEIYNGPGKYIKEKLCHRKAYGKKSFPVPISTLREISKTILDKEKIPKKE